MEIGRDCTYHCSVTLLGIFPCGFTDRADVLLPHQRTIYRTTAFLLIVPDATPKIMCARAQLKSMTSSEQFSGLDILRAYDQYALGRFGVIPPSQALECEQIKICLESRERT